MTPEAIERAVALFCEARRTGRTIEGLPDDCKPGSLDEGYEIQKAFIAAFEHPVAGWKVGATGAAAMELFGVDEPLLGPVFAPTIDTSPARALADDFHHMIIEAEFAFRLASGLPGSRGDEPLSHAALMEAIEAVIPAFEIVSPRYAAIPKGDGPAAVADCGLSGGLVLGAPWRDVAALDLTNHEVRLLIDGEEVAAGTGSLVMGHPLNALAWTAQKLAALGMPLRAGQVVSTGTCTGITPVERGQEIVADFGPLGRLELCFV